MHIINDMTGFIRAHKSVPTGMSFHSSLRSARNDTSLLGYISVIERAWNEMKIDSVLCLDNRPILYLKEYDQPIPFQERKHLQRLFWNQGVANVLVLSDPTNVFIYSGIAKPLAGHQNENEENDILIETVLLSNYVLRIQSFYHALATGHYYEVHKKHFDPNQSVDSSLLQNLKRLRDDLIKTDTSMQIKVAHAFIGRILFLCYLLDRGIVSLGELSHKSTGTALLAEVLENHSEGSRVDYLYNLFADLKNKFNGSMFDQDLDAEKRLIQPDHVNKLILFLGGHDVKNGQRTLDFWLYDFKMIPVETISAIYQDFLATEDREGQKARGAFYTPRFMAEMVVDLALQDTPDAYNWSFLDPACGSGIFLVILFNRLANHWIYMHPKQSDYSIKAEAFQKILAQQIRGIDIELTACRIACFSLYLAYLDFFDPPDIKNYIEKTGRPLPKLLHYGDDENCPTADIPSIQRANFLNENTLNGDTFDCIIGNPPWEGRQSKQLAQMFMNKVPYLLRDGGTGCLLLPTKVFHNQTDAFQSKWLKRVTLGKILQLADYSFLLFQEALCPAIIARFKNISPSLSHHTVEFIAPKFNRESLRQGIININSSMRTWIPLADIINSTHEKTTSIIWKKHLWGTPRDQKFLRLLQSMPPLSEHVDILSEINKQRSKRSKKWIIGQGIKPWKHDKLESDSDRKLKSINWPLDTRFIEATSWKGNLLLFENDTISLEERLLKKRYRTDVLYSQPPPELFKPPMVLVSQGFDKIAYCDFNVLFQDSLQSIAGNTEDSDLLMFLSAYLRSNLARYFLFHTSANWGSERDKVHMNELLRVPFPLPEDDFVSEDAARIVKQVAQKIRDIQRRLQTLFIQLKEKASSQSLFDWQEANIKREWNEKRQDLISKLQTELEPLIYRYFNLTEQEIILVEDTNTIFEPSSTPTTWHSTKTITLDPMENTKVSPYAGHGLATYANTLTKTLNTWAKNEGSNYRVSAEGGVDSQTGLALVTLILSQDEVRYANKILHKDVISVLNQFSENASKHQGTLLYNRDIFIFQGDRLHIVRPGILLNWTRTAALNDAARIYGDIIMATGRSHDSN